MVSKITRQAKRSKAHRPGKKDDLRPSQAIAYRLSVNNSPAASGRLSFESCWYDEIEPDPADPLPWAAALPRTLRKDGDVTKQAIRTMAGVYEGRFKDGVPAGTGTYRLPNGYE